MPRRWPGILRGEDAQKMTEEFYRETWFVPFRAAMLESARCLGKFSSGYADCIGPKEISPRRRGGRGVKSS